VIFSIFKATTPKKRLKTGARYSPTPADVDGWESSRAASKATATGRNAKDLRDFIGRQ
jgi:hypothetical protein